MYNLLKQIDTYIDGILLPTWGNGKTAG